MNTVVGWRRRAPWFALSTIVFAATIWLCGHQVVTGLAPQFLGSPTAVQPRAFATMGLPGKEIPVLPSPHIPRIGYRHSPYNSFPPTSGPHIPWSLPPGSYDQQIPDEVGVHDLEHGHVLIQYSPDLNRAQRAVLRSVAYRYPADVLLAPYHRLPAGAVALTAWGRLEMLNGVDRAAVETFVTALANRYDHGWNPAWRHPRTPPAR